MTSDSEPRPPLSPAAPAPGAPPTWLALAGPTAAGKTALALAVAARWPVEIISVDSALVYRGMDIGTAKPDAAEQAAAPHHLLDLIEPEDSYSAARFVAEAAALIAQIRARGRWPLLVGGTMMYFKALIDGIDALPAADPALRATLDARAAAIGWPAMHAWLAEVDPVTAARLHPTDTQRIQRALEVWHLAGVPLSSLHRRGDGSGAADAAPGEGDGESAPAGPSVPGDRRGVLLSLEPQDRAWLHGRIAQRFDAMLAGGFLDEVRRLRARGALHLGLPSMRCVGYRQAWETLDAGDPPSAAALSDLRERGMAATRQLAKRQITWLRSMPARLALPADAPDVQARLLAAVQARWGEPGRGPAG